MHGQWPPMWTVHARFVGGQAEPVCEQPTRTMQGLWAVNQNQDRITNVTNGSNSAPSHVQTCFVKAGFCSTFHERKPAWLCVSNTARCTLPKTCAFPTLDGCHYCSISDLRLSCSIVSFTAWNTNLMFSVSIAVVKW